MFDALKSKAQGLTRAASIATGFYCAAKYAVQRVEDAKHDAAMERDARDQLFRRFRQLQDNTSFTAQTLLPMLAEQMLAEMDVEGLTDELRNLSQPAPPPQIIPPCVPTSPSMSVVSEEGSSDSRHDLEATASTSSWVEAPSPLAPPQSLSESIMSDVSMSSITTSSSLSNEDAPRKTKAELWKEIKMMSITRTFTATYTITLFTLLTSIQSTLLARRRYILFVRAQEREESRAASFDPIRMLLGQVMQVPDLEDDDDTNYDEREQWWEDEELDEGTEEMFMTLNWWILHVGWKNLKDRIQKAVQDIFAGVSLKTMLSVSDMIDLFSQVRRRIEWEDSTRVTFADILLSPPGEATVDVLIQAGLIPTPLSPSPSSLNPPHTLLPLSFQSLADECRLTVSSVDFSTVLSVALERSSDVLSEGVLHLFASPSPEAAGSRSRIFEIERTMRLANILPGLARWSRELLNGLPNPLVERLVGVREVECLSAIVFGRFSERSGRV